MAEPTRHLPFLPGSSLLTQEDLDAFCSQHGLSDPTFAQLGAHPAIATLTGPEAAAFFLGFMTAQQPWDGLPLNGLNAAIDVAYQPFAWREVFEYWKSWDSTKPLERAPI